MHYGPIPRRLWIGGAFSLVLLILMALLLTITRYPLRDSLLLLSITTVLFLAAGLLTWRDRHYQTRLRESEARYRTLAQHLPEIGIIQFDQELRAILVDGPIFTTGGYNPAAIEGELLIKTLPPEAHADYLPLYLRALEGQAGTIERIGVNGRHYVVHAIPIPALFSSRAGMAVIQDVTDRKRLQAQFIQAQKMEGIGRLAGGIAHDFNNLLTAIMGISELLLTSTQPETQEHQDAAEILTVSRRGAALTHQLLAFSRQQIIQPRTLNLNTLVVESMTLLRRLVPEAIELSSIPGDDVPHIIGDPHQLDQVLVNLAVNARDAMPQGGTSTVTTGRMTLPDPPDPHLPSGDWVVLTVTDTGSGMRPEVLEKAMEPFFTTKAHGKGTGLGLATCYGIVQQHGGTIRLQSAVGHGTTVEILLPPAIRSPLPDRADDALGVPLSQDDPITHGRGRVLLVEDDAAVRNFVSRTLRMAGYMVESAVNGLEALERLEELAATDAAPIVDLVLSDVIMPLLNGPQLAAEIDRRYPGVRVALMSGYTDNTITQAGVVDAGILFLQKPFTAQHLTAQIARMFSTPVAKERAC